MLLIT